MSKEHSLALSKLCRACGSVFRNKKGPQGAKYSCKDLLRIFNINIATDKTDTHPEFFCHPCCNIIYHSTKAKKEGAEYHHRKVTATWFEHSDIDDSNCPICTSVILVLKEDPESTLKASETLALKSSLMLGWNQLRSLRRY